MRASGKIDHTAALGAMLDWLEEAQSRRAGHRRRPSRRAWRRRTIVEPMLIDADSLAKLETFDPTRALAPAS